MYSQLSTRLLSLEKIVLPDGADFFGSIDFLALFPLDQMALIKEQGKRKKIKLTETEFRMMMYLLGNNGKAVSYDDISLNIYGSDGAVNNLIKQHVNNLRQKLKDAGRFIETLYCFGLLSKVPGSNTTTPNLHYQFGDFLLDVDAHKLFRGSEEVKLTLGEYITLKCLIEYKGGTVLSPKIVKAYSRYDRYSGEDGEKLIYASHSERAMIKYLKDALGDNPFAPKYIQSVFGEGYRFIVQFEKRYAMPLF